MNDATQTDLFAAPPGALEVPEIPPEHHTLAKSLPAGLRLGTTSWSYPGWTGLVYRANTSTKLLASHGLTAYAQHPLFDAVEIDRTYYGPLPPSVFQSFAASVPADFRFLVKAHEDCVVQRFPLHARYGKKRGMDNPRFLDAAYATDAVVAPFVEGLGEKGAALLFQFPPQSKDDPRGFADRLYGFLAALPKGITYAVELRNAELLTADYAAALEAAGAVHCHNVWTAMPPIHDQARRIPPAARRPLVVRWLLREGMTYEAANARYAPFHRTVDPDDFRCDKLADLITRAVKHDVPALVLVDNKAEGCAPESVVRLARALAR
ncbi:MAG TPA: DUF72 domain-containing protein [Polyangiaceae bacterium]|jgi:uncharacterized protein YecE (DUF72 family)